MNRFSDWLSCTSRCGHPAVSMLYSRATIGFPACSLHCWPPQRHCVKLHKVRPSPRLLASEELGPSHTASANYDSL